jgi:hypothetical protein
MVEERFASDVRAALEQRLGELGMSVDPMTDHELEDQFGRKAEDDSVLHYEIELAGIPCAYSVRPVSAGDAESQGEQQETNAEIERLRGESRVVVAHGVTLGARGLLLTDVVPSKEASPEDADELQSAMQRFAQAVWDMDTVRPFLREQSSENGGGGG